MSFQISALSEELFRPLFDQTDEWLHRQGARRVIADECPGYPCRVSLKDANVGERLLLVNHVHQPANSPYRSSHAIYVREGACQMRPQPGDVPLVLRRRLLSVRAFDQTGMMIDADVCDGEGLERPVKLMLANRHVAYLHAHNAKPGCYHARIDRIS